ncbi:MAG: hypothetical protein LBT33_00720 [Spirochaetia bacterium]|nr:hypothetical protein [Spirochaetia bacterium]
MQECLVTCEGADFRVFGFFHREEMVVLAGGLCSDFRDVEEDAGRLNVGPGAVSRMENRAGDMRLSDLMGAARLFGKTARILFE